MKKITGEEFERKIIKDPAWCKTIKEPLEVTTSINLSCSKISHLSPLLTFSGKDHVGWVACFAGCKDLKIATGTYKGYVSFEESGIEKIENLTVIETRTSPWGATGFAKCKNLKGATGNFEGFVDFESSGVETIKDLNIETSNRGGEKARFLNCPIKYVPKEYRGEEFILEPRVIESSILKDKITKEAINKIKSETNNIEL